MKKLLVFITLLGLLAGTVVPHRLREREVSFKRAGGGTPGRVSSSWAAAPAASGIPNFDHIVLIMLENQGLPTGWTAPQSPCWPQSASRTCLLSNYFCSNPSEPAQLHCLR